jgi:hypothetical protein
MDIDVFIQQVNNFQEMSSSEKIDYFVYYILVILKKDDVAAKDIDELFNCCHLVRYSNTSAYLLRNTSGTKKKRVKFIKTKTGYILERTFQEEISKTLQKHPLKIETSRELRDLLNGINSKVEQDFLKEALDCYEIGARRAAIVLVWILTINHLYEFVFNKELTSFNTELSKNTDKRIKISQIITIDDFSEIPEGKFIELLRSSKTISNDIRKILDVKLGIRNSSAHPSNITISEIKATDFIIDLVDNVIKKFTV